MLTEFLDFMGKNALAGGDDRILLGVSGGVDSMVMTDLFRRSGFDFALAHCNFSLRGAESDGDEAFVREYAERNGLPFFTVRFETEAHARLRGISIQMAARALRLEWMEGLASEKGYARIALGHHRDDELETFFLNLLRGTGITGLHGILPLSGRIIRPMLFANRPDILHYAVNHAVTFREDSSNSKLDYIRNRIRHVILPEFEKLNPDFRNTLSQNIEHFRSAGNIFLDQVSKVRGSVMRETELGILVDLGPLKALPEQGTYLFELLRPFGFNTSDAGDIRRALEGQPGKTFLSGSHRLLLGRDQLLITPLDLEEVNEAVYAIPEGQSTFNGPFELRFRVFRKDDDFSLSRSPRLVHLDAGRVAYPLLLRKWRTADRFIPLGMKHRKLVSDFITDLKLDILRKQGLWILESGGEIAWIVGHRIDERFKVNTQTVDILEIAMGP